MSTRVAVKKIDPKIPTRVCFKRPT